MGLLCMEAERSVLLDSVEHELADLEVKVEDVLVALLCHVVPRCVCLFRDILLELEQIIVVEGDGVEIEIEIVQDPILEG